MASKSKKEPQVVGVLVPSSISGLPLWDDAQIQQENWGGSIGLPTRHTGAVVEFRNLEGKILVAHDEAQREAFKEALTHVLVSTAEDIIVDWKRPVDIFAPFRPMVHRNITPFLFPYDTERTLFDGKAAEEAARLSATPAGKKGDSKNAVPLTPLHVQFPEIVHVLDPQSVAGAAREWEGLPDERVVARYRELQPLMQAYDPKLELGCAAKPLEACESQYTTVQRHRLQEVDAISKLVEPPPFLMDAFNSAVTFIEHAQSYVKHGEYLWELVYPHASVTCHPVYNPHGKYAVRLFIDGAFRRVTIDDYLPVDALGRPFFSLTSQKEIWPALLAKAIFVALGPNCHLLFTDPETIITCLWGEWVPQRVDPRSQPTAACAFLIAYQKELVKGDGNATHFSFSNTEETATAMAAGEEAPGKQKKSSVVEDALSKKEAPIMVSSPNSPSVSPAGEDVTDVLTTFPVCAISPVEDGKRQLLVIHEILFFRDTLAIHISTTSPLKNFESKILTEISDDELVQDLLHFKTLNEHKCKIPGAVSSSQFTFWTTFEELAAHMEIVVWRYLGEKTPFHFSSRLVGIEEGSPVPATGKKKSAAPAAAKPFSGGGKRNIVRWMHLKSDRPEQIAFVSLAAFALPDNSLKLPRAYQRSISSGSLVASAQSPGRSNGSRTPRDVVRGVSLDLYAWERGGTLSRVGFFPYESGKLQCMVHSLPPGSHVLRLTAVELEPQHVLSILSTKEFFIGDEKDAIHSANIFRMTDAGSHMGVERANEEVMWLKRRISVKEPTVISFVVSTLDPGEDLAAHRDIPVALLKEVKVTKSRTASTKGSQKESVEENQVRVGEVSIIPHCHFLLMNVDNGAVRTGVAGRLICQRLEPNQHGYLLMMYVLIDSLSAASFIESGMGIPLENQAKSREGSNFYPLDEKGNTAAREKALPLYGRGNWKLTISADRGLELYKSIPQNVFSFADKGKLRRGSHALLFVYTCAVVEKTSFTLILDLDSHDPIPFHVKVARNGVDAPPVFVSETCTTHLFLPHVTLELGEKPRSTSYVIEAWLDEEKVQQWEERCRVAQETKFRTLREDAERRAMERRQNDLDEYHADPRAFQGRLEQLNAAQMEPVHPPSLRESLLASNKKGRLYPDKRKHPVGGVMPEKEKVASGPSSPTVPSNPVIFLLDTTDSELTVSFSLRLQFSSKVDIKNGAPPKDPLATLRAGWVPPIDHVMVDQGTGYTQRGGGIKGKQRETQVSAEELLKADQGRLSRQRFLENPRNILLPYLAASDDGSLPSKESARTGLSKDQGVMPVNPSRVVLDVSEEANYLHAPILNESEYSIQVIPLRAVEIMPSCDQTPPTSASGFMQQRARSPGERVSPRLAAFPQPTFMPNAAADEDADVNELRVPIQEVYRGLNEKLKKQQDERVQWRECTKEVLREFWGAQKPGASLVSLLGSKEELPVKQRKSRQKQ
ncbi:hypothetical protein TcBrA4_0104440 [Trypanosoma cruzi]|nr:hypothetical protein TcBrA4_0104440 [Trypanosoma cruzi]